MEIGRNTRRRLSATSNLNLNFNTADTNDDEAIPNLMRSHEGADFDIKEGPLESRNYVDLSRWLRPLGLIFTILFLATIFFNSSLKVFWPASSSRALHPYGASQGMLGIRLHPEDHVSRPPKTITHRWNITSGIRSPDGVKKQVYSVNGLFPGPTIECRSGDKLVIHVTNSLPSEGVSIHWHGLEMRGANSVDGAVGFTQCPIPAGESFTYEFAVGEDQAGTFWWHAHSQVQRGDGMYGGLVVHKPIEVENEMKKYEYEKEVLIMIGDWYHRSAEEVLAWYMSVRGFGNEPVPDSLLVNGAGRFICSMAVPARPVECVEIAEKQMPSLFGKHLFKVPTRLRLVNVGSLAGFTVELSLATLTPLTIDGGHPIAGRRSNSVGVLHPGERVDLLVQWDEDASYQSPELRISLDPENFKYPNQALRPNQTFPAFYPATDFERKSLSSKSKAHFDLSSTTAVADSKMLPATANQTILLYAKTQKLAISDNHPTGYMNRTTWSPQSTPPLPLISLTRSEWDGNQLIPHIPLSPTSETWVDIIINNLDDGAHPFHLHGYSFYVLASHRSEHGWGSYSPYSKTSVKPVFNLENPVSKDTVSVPRRGYVVIRFKAINSGIWMLHCHVLFHQASGMAMGIQVGGDLEHSQVDTVSSSTCRIPA